MVDKELLDMLSDKNLADFRKDLEDLAMNNVPTSWPSILKTVKLLGYDIRMLVTQEEYMEVLIVDDSKRQVISLLRLRILKEDKALSFIELEDN